MRYLVFALQGLGDALEATPILHAIRHADATAEVDVAVTRGGPARLFRGIPEYVSSVVELPYWERGARGFLAALGAHAWRRRYDVSLMSYPSAKLPYHIVNMAFRARRKIAHRYVNPSPANLLWSYTDLIAIRDVPNVERNLDLLAPAGVKRPERGTYIVPPAWYGSGERVPLRVTIHIGTAAHDGFENRRWPLENFAEVARSLRDAGYEIALLSGPDELAETKLLAAEVPGARLIVGSLEEAARHLASSAVVLSNDSGIGHLAAAVGARVVSLFGPTPTTHAPYGPTSYPLRPSDCPPCFHPLSRGISCVRNIDYRCLKLDLTVSYVLESLYTVLERPRVDV